MEMESFHGTSVAILVWKVIAVVLHENRMLWIRYFNVILLLSSSVTIGIPHKN